LIQLHTIGQAKTPAKPKSLITQSCTGWRHLLRCLGLLLLCFFGGFEMAEVKFTKGPWVHYIRKADLNAGYVDIESCNGVFICGYNMYSSDAVECIANANLIAAAPDMYAMLEKIAGATVHNFDYATAKPIYELIAKARGES
jgi:hypothetical protein